MRMQNICKYEWISCTGTCVQKQILAQIFQTFLVKITTPAIFLVRIFGNVMLQRERDIWRGFWQAVQFTLFSNFISLLGLMIKLLPIDAILCCKYRFVVQPGWSNQEGQERKIFLLLSWGTAWQRSKKKSGSIFCYHNDEKVQAKYDPTLKVQLSIPQSPPGISRERASLLPILFTSHPPPNPQ